MLNFKKMHGLGNDFIIIDGRESGVTLSPDQIRSICDRKRGVGCDQIVILRYSKHWQETTFLEMYNNDASVIEACGNMTRCVADVLMTEDQTDNVIIETLNGSLNCWKEEGGLIRVEMGKPKLTWTDIPLSKECDTLYLEGLKPINELKPTTQDALPVAVNVGNPHCIFFTDQEITDQELEKLGSHFENDPLFPNKVNVEFVQVLAHNHIRMRVWERGVGITEACGSGACAAAVAAIRRGLTERKMTVTLDGGDLIINWPSDDSPVHMTGPVSYVFDGELML